MKDICKILVALLMLIIWTSCEKDVAFFNQGLDLDLNITLDKTVKPDKARKVTGGLEIIWNGNSQNGGQKRAFAEFNAFDQGSFDKGIIKFIVRNLDMTVHREITVDIFDVLVDPFEQKAWFLGDVITDTKACSIHGGDGHDEGGCDHEDNDEVGCDHEDGDVSHDDGHDGGCSGGEDDHGSGGSVSGQNCRIGQVLMAKVHDLATPGVKGDGMTWKWFDPKKSQIPNTGAAGSWPHLCKKDIIGGNLVVH